MTDRIENLMADDFEECVTFLDHAFSEGMRFDEVWPALYRPTDESMHCNLAIRRGGKIAAIVGVFPITWQVGEHTLKMAGIGGVSVDPKYRGQGLMNKLMDRAVQWIREAGYQLSYLGGQRQRYRYWGWERCGVCLDMELSARNTKHEPVPPGAPTISFKALEDEGAALQALHDARPVRCCRREDLFVDYLHSRRSKPRVALDEDGQVVGYVVIAPSETSVEELVYADAQTGVQMMRALVDEKGDAFTLVQVGPQDLAFMAMFGQMVETTGVSHACNWQIFDWPATIDALLAHQARTFAMLDGQVVVGIEGVESPLCLSVDGATGSCRTTDDAPALTLDANTMMRVLFGPTQPHLVTTIPPEARLLESWCPLPLGIPRLDWC